MLSAILLILMSVYRYVWHIAIQCIEMRKEVMKKTVFLILALALVIVFCFSAFAFADDIGDEVANGLNTAITTLKKIINPIAVIAVIGCGIYCIAGGDPTYLKRAKTWGISIFVGLIIINLAPSIVAWASSIGK